jgi:hypothetical protein
MKTKLTPLALLIPAVVLAQPAPMPPAQTVMSPPSTMPAPAVKPVNPAKAAAALSTAKELSNRLKGGSLSRDAPNCGSSSITLTHTYTTGVYNKQKTSYSCIKT